MLCHSEIKSALSDLTKDCNGLWEENKDMQARFVNDLAELHRFQIAISQLENDHRTEKAACARALMCDMQMKATNLYNSLTEKRCNLVQKLSDGVQNVALMQNQLISDHLYNWKNHQKFEQIGIAFKNRDQMLDDIQNEFETLAEQNWQLRTYACWQIDLLRRGPQLNDNIAQTHITNLSTISDSFTKLLCMLVSQSFVVALQPDSVLKTQHKFFTEVRLLIGDKLGIKQHLVNTTVTVRIIAEEEAHLLSIAQLSEKDVKTVGSISNDFEKMTLDENGHMSAKFANSKLTRIAHRKPPAKTSQAEAKTLANSQTATDQKYALLFHITPFHLGNLGKFDVWTLSLPIMVTVHGSQDCDAQGAILWQRAFSDVNRTAVSGDVGAVSWLQLSQVLRNKFALFTGAQRTISDSDLAYMAEKLMIGTCDESQMISFHRFAKENIREDVTFSFWEWFFAIMQLIKQKLLKFWDEGWLIGFISKQDASCRMVSAPHPTFLLRFSDTQTGAVSIGFVCDDGDQKVPFHLSPFSIKDLDQLSLAQRIASCPQLKEIKYLYPDIEKEGMLRFFEAEEQQKSVLPTGYIQSEIVMVAKTGSKSVCVGGSSPSSNQSRLELSPGDIAPQIQAMETNESFANDEMTSVISPNSLVNNVEALLGPDFNPQLSCQLFQPIDLSFIHTSNGTSFEVNSFIDNH